MSPAVWTLVHAAVGVGFVLTLVGIGRYLDNRAPHPDPEPTPPAPAPGATFAGCVHVVTAVVDGKRFELGSERPFTADDLTHVEHLLSLHFGPEDTAEIIDTLAAAIAAEAAADIDDELRALGGAA